MTRLLNCPRCSRLSVYWCPRCRSFLCGAAGCSFSCGSPSEEVSVALSQGRADIRPEWIAAAEARRPVLPAPVRATGGDRD